ncbi:MAG: M24 family metallopeptidase [bacterium]
MPAPKELLQERIGRVQKALRESYNVPMLVTDPANVGWLSGIPGDFQKDARMLVSPDAAWFITDGRYENRVPEILGVKTYIWGMKHLHLYPELRELTGGAKTLVVDVKGLPIDVYHALPAMLGVNKIEAPSGFLDRLRMIKGDRELVLIHEALEIAMNAFCWSVEEWLPRNMATRTDMDYRDAFDAHCEEMGGEGMSFETIVVMDFDGDTPHPDMSRAPRPLKDGKTMLVDWGIFYKGVCTDLTRMVLLGCDELPKEIVRLRDLQVVWMDDVIGEMVPGKPAWAAGMKYVEGMKAAGIERPFHGAGHGTGGAYVHELPRASMRPEGQDDYGIPFGQSIILEPGMIVTSEPGMYEKGVGAYRTENMVLITPDGHEIMDAALSLDLFAAKPK